MSRFFAIGVCLLALAASASASVLTREDVEEYLKLDQARLGVSPVTGTCASLLLG